MFTLFRQLFEKCTTCLFFYCANKRLSILCYIKHLFAFHTDFSRIFQPRISCAVFSIPAFSSVFPCAAFSCLAFSVAPLKHRSLDNARKRKRRCVVYSPECAICRHIISEFFDTASSPHNAGIKKIFATGLCIHQRQKFM